MAQYLIGIDVGGTKTECVLFSLLENGQTGHGVECLNLSLPDGGNATAAILVRERIATQRTLPYPTLVEHIKDLIESVLKKGNINIQDILGIGIGLPGTIDPATQIMLNGNTKVFIGQNLAQDLKTALKASPKILIENDANLFALAEVLGGAGKLYTQETKIPGSDQIGIGIILGTGVGGGIVVRSQIVQGRHGGGGEIGHTNLINHGHPCYCGHAGCAEQYLSGPGIEAAFNQRLYSQIEKRPNAREIFELAEKKEPLAVAVVEQYKQYLTAFLAKLSNIFDPDYFVFGGGLSKQDLIYQGLEEALGKSTYVPQTKPRIYKHCLGDSAGVVGAAMLLLIR